MKDKKILVTGGTGFLGKHVMEYLIKKYPNCEIIATSSSIVDLKDKKKSLEYFKRIEPDIVIGLAARLGGIGDNKRNPASYFYDNMLIGMNTINGSNLIKADKLILIGTVCSYPKIVSVPFKEENLWDGYPEPTNGAYGISKKAISEYSLAVKKQYGLNVVNLLLTNLYGPGDDFREETSHVIPAAIKKMIDAKHKDKKEVIAWGDGSPTRDFLYVEDAAQAIGKAINCSYCLPINVGNSEEISIRELYELIKEKTEYKGKIIWDISHPNGQPKRLLDISKAKKYLNFVPKTQFSQGLDATLDWYLKNESELSTLF